MKMVLVFLEEVMGGRTDCLMEKNAAFIDLKLDPAQKICWKLLNDQP